MSTMSMARQPIFSSKLDIVGYELLYRPPVNSAQGAFDGELATSSVLARAFMDLDPGSIVGEHKVFVNFTSSLLLSGAARTLSSEHLVVEVLEDVVVDELIVEAVRQLVDEGYTIALDDFVYSPMWDPLLEIAHIVKLDVLALGMDGLRQQLRMIERFDVKLLAEKIETSEEYEACRQLGFHYFQGFFLCRPSAVVGEGLEDDKGSVLGLLSKAHDLAASLDQFNVLIRRDPP
ncbi:MAG: EAL and modified HD-GYP domain-containing signal transduction protein [Kiritimatiellia bacterium]|jgi:EAL and modified HD-GYP domain-containing signal transduction protein